MINNNYRQEKYLYKYNKNYKKLIQILQKIVTNVGATNEQTKHNKEK